MSADTQSKISDRVIYFLGNYEQFAVNYGDLKVVADLTGVLSVELVPGKEPEL